LLIRLALKIVVMTREQGTGNREQGTGNREQGTGNREEGTGNREQGTGNREQGRGNREQGRGNREEGTGKREQGRGKREQVLASFTFRYLCRFFSVHLLKSYTLSEEGENEPLQVQRTGKNQNLRVFYVFLLGSL
jgi:hypothetical protein